MSAIPQRQLTVDEAAKQAGVHPETIRRAIRKGELKATRDRLAQGSPLMVGEDNFKRFVAQRRA